MNDYGRVVSSLRVKHGNWSRRYRFKSCGNTTSSTVPDMNGIGIWSAAQLKQIEDGQTVPPL